MITDEELDGSIVKTGWLAPEVGLIDRWERLRFVYNAVLAVETALLVLGGGSYAWGNPKFWWFVIPCAYLANLCYCAGPAFEGILNAARPTDAKVTLILFTCGLVLSACLTLLMIVGWGLSQI